MVRRKSGRNQRVRNGNSVRTRKPSVREVVYKTTFATVEKEGSGVAKYSFNPSTNAAFKSFLDSAAEYRVLRCKVEVTPLGASAGAFGVIACTNVNWHGSDIASFVKSGGRLKPCTSSTNFVVQSVTEKSDWVPSSEVILGYLVAWQNLPVKSTFCGVSIEAHLQLRGYA